MKASSDGSLEPQTNHLVVDQSEASGKQGTAAHGKVTTIAPIRLNLTYSEHLCLYSEALCIGGDTAGIRSGLIPRRRRRRRLVILNSMHGLTFFVRLASKGGKAVLQGSIYSLAQRE